MAPRVGFEPTAARLTVESSTAELPGNSVEGRSINASLADASPMQSGEELLHRDAVVERVFGVEQQR